MTNVIIGRDILTLLGLDNHTLLAAACDRLQGEFDAEGVQKNPSNGELNSLLENSVTNNVFHSNSHPDDDGIPETFYMDIGCLLYTSPSPRDA